MPRIVLVVLAANNSWMNMGIQSAIRAFDERECRGRTGSLSGICTIRCFETGSVQVITKRVKRVSTITRVFIEVLLFKMRVSHHDLEKSQGSHESHRVLVYSAAILPITQMMLLLRTPPRLLTRATSVRDRPVNGVGCNSSAYLSLWKILKKMTMTTGSKSIYKLLKRGG